MRHIFDNDTSGLSGQFRMTVRYRCGQCNELSLVCVFLKEFCLLMRAEKEFRGCHGQIKLCNKKGGNMGSNITKEQINTTMALALMKHLYNQGKISEKVYKKILSQYGKKGLADSRTSC